MKNLAFLLSVFVLLLATIPCCLAEDCIKEKASTEQTSNGNKEQSGADTDCGICSPFYRCHSCPGFAFPNTTLKLNLVLLVAIESYTTYSQTFISTFPASIWQPPKFA